MTIKRCYEVERKFEWKEEQQLSFEDFKSELTNAWVLKLYDANATETILFTDASSRWIATILMQRTRDGADLHPVYYLKKIYQAWKFTIIWC